MQLILFKNEPDNKTTIILYWPIARLFKILVCEIAVLKTLQPFPIVYMQNIW